MERNYNVLSVDRPISLAAAVKAVPSLAQDKPHSKMGARYVSVSTLEILEEIMPKYSLGITQVRGYRKHDPEREKYAMHMLRLSFLDGNGNAAKPVRVGDVLPQIVIRNSHDGGSAFEMYSGLFRLVCSNGLIVSDSSLVQPIKVRHTARPVFAAMAAVEEVIRTQQQVSKHIEEMRQTVLDNHHQVLFATRALELRDERNSMVKPETLLLPRRAEDAGSDVWSVFNRVQENITKGGLEGVASNGRRTVTRPVESIIRDMNFNIGVWGIAMNAINKAAESSKEAVAA